MNKLLSVLLLAGLTAVCQDDNRPGPVILQSPGTIAWPFPGVTLTVRPDTIIITNVLTLEISASAAPITSFNINWTTNGPQPGTVNFSDIHSRTTQVTLSIAGTYNLLCVINDGPRFVATPFTIIANAVQNFAPTITPIANQSLDENHSTPAIPFTVGDDITAPGALSVNATSSNPALIDNTGIFLGGGGANRNISLVPKNMQAGTSTITVSVTDGSTPPMTTSISFLLTVSAVNQPPTFTSVPNPVNFSENVPGTFNVGIADPDTPLANVQLIATSTASFLSSLVVTGSGAVRTVNVLPVPNQYGTNTIILHLSDGQNQVSTTLGINVAAVNNPPVIGSISPLQQLVGIPTTTIFYINDTEDGGNLTLSRSSDNLAVAPLANLVFGGSGTNRTITFTPAAVGVANVSVWVTDSGSLSATNTFTATGNAIPNTAPTITPPPNTTVWKNQPTGNLPITVGDAETPAVNLILFATSDNLVLTPLSGFTLGGSGANRTIRIVPASNQVGTATITVSVTDGGNLTTPSSFALTVSPTNYPPTISSISSPQTVAENSSISIPFTVGDPDTALASLVLSGVSSDPVVVPAPNITFSGTGASRTGKIQPATNKYGTNTVTFSVNDGTTTVSTNFTLQVTFVNQLPTITGLPTTLTLDFNTPSSALPFTIGDLETPVANLQVSSQIGNPSLIASTTFGGAGANRTIIVTPVTGQSGSTTVRAVVTDGNGESSSQTINVIVNQQQGGIPTSGFFISTTGGTGAGTNAATAWSMAYVASGGAAGKLPAGQTNVITVLPGTYVNTISGHTTGFRWQTHGTASFPLIIKGLNYPYDGSPSIIDNQDNRGEGGGGYSSIDANDASFTWFVDLRIINTASKVYNRQRNSLQHLALISDDKGIGNKYIGCALSDGGNDVRMQNSGTTVVTVGPEINGNLSRYSGWTESVSGDPGYDPGPTGHPNGAAGWGMYIQNTSLSAMRYVRNSIFAEDASGGTEINGTTDPNGVNLGGPTYSVTLDGNAYIYPGGTAITALQNGCPGSGLVLGDFHITTNVHLLNSMVWIPANNASCGGGIRFGQNGTIINDRNEMRNCLIVGNLSSWVNQNHGSFVDNIFVGFHYPVVVWGPTGSTGPGTANVFDRNGYYLANGGNPWRIGSNNEFTLGQVHSNLGFEANGVYTGSAPPLTNTVVLRRLDYDARRATLTIINWSHDNTVPINFSTDINGRTFAADGKNWKAIWVLNYSTAYTSGQKNGTVNFPMTGGPGIEPCVGPGLGPAVTTLPECWAGMIILTN